MALLLLSYTIFFSLIRNRNFCLISTNGNSRYLRLIKNLNRSNIKFFSKLGTLPANFADDGVGEVEPSQTP